MKTFIAILGLFMLNSAIAQSKDYVKISEDFIQAVTNGSSGSEHIAEVANAKEEDLMAQLKTDDLKKTFFINMYNGYVITALKKNPIQYEDRNKFFKDEQFVIAGHKVSPDNIENGFLRKSSLKFGLGLIINPFPGSFERNLRVKKKDYRVHFALNCGAKSCPPVRLYKHSTIEDQLTEAKEYYLKKEVKYDSSKNTVLVPAFMSWFRGDFGGKCGTLDIIKELGIIDKGIDPEVEYNDYDWTMDLNNFK